MVNTLSPITSDIRAYVAMRPRDYLAGPERRVSITVVLQDLINMCDAIDAVYENLALEYLAGEESKNGDGTYH